MESIHNVPSYPVHGVQEPPNAPLRPSSSTQNNNIVVNPPWPFAGSPSPQTIHHHILHKKTAKRYYSVTTLSDPSTSWSPLASAKQHMESRTCFHTGSRIHMLTCGHTIAVNRDAEPCGANCKPRMSTISTGSTVPTPYASALETQRNNMIESINAYTQVLFDHNVAKAKVVYDLHVKTILDIWENQDQTLQGHHDLISGDFSCTLCNTRAQRDAFPAFVLDRFPYSCVVVGKDNQDIMIIRELEKGVVPQLPQPPLGAPRHPRGFIDRSSQGALKRLGTGNDKGLRRSGATPSPVTGPAAGSGVGRKETSGERKRRLKDGYHSAIRRKEKEDVLEKLRKESLLEDFEATGLEEL